MRILSKTLRQFHHIGFDARAGDIEVLKIEEYFQKSGCFRDMKLFKKH